MDGISGGRTASHGFGRSAVALTTCLVVVALLLLPYAMRQSGSAGPMGVAAAGAICLVAGLAAEGFGVLFARLGTPLAALLTGMAARMTPPLLICLILAWQGADGRRWLAFIFYLLAFYLATLVVETWLAVKRANHTAINLNHSTR